MLAYVFWHWPSPEADRASYERGLAAFHRVLREAKPPGFQRSAVYRARRLPWLRTEGPGYEDWYLVDGTAALDPLNDAAVSGARKGPHDEVARLSQVGAGGLYRLRAGVVDAAPAGFAVWLSKPRGTSYEALDARLRPWTERASVGLWRRQMVLGPTPEFCLRSPDRPDLPEDLAPLSVELEPVWP